MSMMRTLFTAVAGVAAATAMGMAAKAQPAQGDQIGSLLGTLAQPAPGVLRVDLSTRGSTQRLSIPQGKSAIIELPADVRDLLVSNPATADAVLRTTRRVHILGLSPGQTDAVLFDGAGRKLLTLDIRVEQDMGALFDTLSRVAPNASVRAEAVNDRIILSGEVSSLAESDRIVRVASGFVRSPANVVNMLTIAAPEQVMLKVQIAEMQRNVIKQLGVDLEALIDNGGKTVFAYAHAATFGVNAGIQGGGALGVGYNDGTTDIQSTLQAFERVGLLRTLAEPNMTAVSGESAKFLVGGEFPVPVGGSDEGVTVEFKQFGVGLGFTPVVLSDGRIALKVSTEVSELTNIGSFSIGTPGSSSSIVIPALTVRRAETAVELASGSSMMIAGLLQTQTRQNIDAIPGATNLPILGALFRSRDYIMGETELVVIITPYLVKGTSRQDLQTPIDGMRMASDAGTLLLGRLNEVYRAEPQALAGRTYQGPYGHVID